MPTKKIVNNNNNNNNSSTKPKKYHTFAVKVRSLRSA